MGQNSTQEHQSHVPSSRLGSTRLDSWKEIAAYLHRDARTVRRWERDRRLPVHRVPGGERSGVFAYVAELDQWLLTKPPDPAVLAAGLLKGSDDDLFGAPSSQGPEAAQSATSLSATDLPLSNEDEGSLDALSGKSHVAFAESISYTGLHPDEDRMAEPGTLVSPPLHDWKAKSPDHSRIPQLPSNLSDGSTLHSPPRRWALQGMALLLILAIAGGSAFAFVHYRRFHASVSTKPLPSIEAQDLYLRGRYYWNLRTEEGLNQAADLFTQSIVNDPHYAPAYAGLADCYLLLRQYGHMPDAEAYPRALAAARQAVSLDASSPDAHRSIAFVLRFWNWDMPSAEREYLRAIELDPKSSQSHHWYATALLSSGRFKEAWTQINIAREIEPQSVSVLADRGLILGSQDPARGADALRQLAQSQPRFASIHGYLSKIYLNSGDYAGFLLESRIAATLANDSAKVETLDRARRTLTTHGPSTMLRNLASDYATLAERGQASSYLTAQLFGFAGEPAQAMRYLQIACDRREPGFLSVERDAAFRDVRSSQEFASLIARRETPVDSQRQPIALLDKRTPF